MEDKYAYMMEFGRSARYVTISTFEPSYSLTLQAGHNPGDFVRQSTTNTSDL